MSMSCWPELRERGWLSSLSDDPVAVAYWSHVLQLAYEGMDTWDYAFLLSCWVNGGLTAVPRVNLVSNIGFRPDAAHTNGEYRTVFSNMDTDPMALPLRHPRALE